MGKLSNGGNSGSTGEVGTTGKQGNDLAIYHNYYTLLAYNYHRYYIIPPLL